MRHLHVLNLVGQTRDEYRDTYIATGTNALVSDIIKVTFRQGLCLGASYIRCCFVGF